MCSKYTNLYLIIGLSMLMAHSEATPAAPSAADLSMTLTATPNPVIVNGQLTYTLTVRNEGQKAAKTINVTDVLPIEMQYLSSSPDCKAAKFKKTKKVVCKLKKLEPSLSSSWTITVKPVIAGTVVNHAQVKALGRDANSLNNDAGVRTEVVLKLNQQPLAESVSLSVDSAANRTITQQLVATDADNDTLTFELLAPENGNGYTQARVNAQSGVLTLTLVEGFSGNIALPFRATDGKEFSNTVEVTIAVAKAQEERRTGLLDIDPAEYANIASSRLSSDLLGAPGGESIEPPSIDLTAYFPMPGNQGSQGSCTAWATAYALKSYQEGREIGWSLDAAPHQFSPAFIYNQINNGEDKGSAINQAMALIVNRGASTLATMPYNEYDFLSLPSQSAFNEASQFKAAAYERLDGTDEIKAALINKQPVVVGLTVFSSLHGLKGENSIYNTTSPPTKPDGTYSGHAVTIIGYDDNKFGGAFKIINSWGTDWGDNGYFWLPYNFVATAVNYGFRLIDKENTIDIPLPPPPPPSGKLPNLEPKSWTASYDEKPGGLGSLQWEVINSGAGTAPAGAYVNLMLSGNDIISVNDFYLVYEKIPDITVPGGSWYRNGDNPIEFTMPESLTPGEYYMALWVDDLEDIEESNEDDNISFGTDTVFINNTLPDFRVKDWYAEWNNSTGDGTLTYEILNAGGRVAQAPYDVNFVLSENQVVGDGDEYYMFYETINYSLPEGYIQFRDENGPAYFNVFSSQANEPIPNGVYYMGVWVDDLNKVIEANEENNWSLSDPVSVEHQLTFGEGNAKRAINSTALEINGMSKAYNGKKLPPSRAMLTKKVKISETADGGRKMEVLEEPQKQETSQHVFSKSMWARNKVIFPIVDAKPMKLDTNQNGDGSK